MSLALVRANTHMLALELIVFVKDRQDATHPASAAVPAVAQADPIASMLHEDERRLAGPFLQPCRRIEWVGYQHQRRREIERDRLTGLAREVMK
jgi:hypothetical protein